MLSLYFTQQLSALYVQESQRKTQDEMLFDQESVLFEQEAILFDWLHKQGVNYLVARRSILIVGYIRQG